MCPWSVAAITHQEIEELEVLAVVLRKIGDIPYQIEIWGTMVRSALQRRFFAGKFIMFLKNF
jgi:hypothetical protein